MINDNTLTLYYYDDGLDDAERRTIADALEHDAELASRYRDLQAELDQLADVNITKAPPEAIVRWRYELDKAAERDRSGSNRQPLMWLLPLAAVLVLGIAIGMNLGPSTPSPAPQQIASEAAAPLDAPATNTGGSPQLALTRGLSDYMRVSQVQLVGLKDADAEERIHLITQIIEQNRLFERAANASEAPQLARVLRAFEQMLVELAREEAAPRDIDARTDQLSFEYAVMLTKLSRGTSQEPTSL